MTDVYDVRHANLLRLIEQYGSVAEINALLGRKRNDAAISIVKNRAVLGGGKPRQMGSTLARTIETGLKLPRGWMDTDHSGILVEESEDDSDRKGVVIPELENQGSMGNDITFYEQDVIVGGVKLADEFIRRLSPSSPFNLKIMTGRGDSMMPTIAPGDKLLIDEGIKDLYDGIYVIRGQDGLYIKRVSRNLKGKVFISSDNPSVKLSEELDGAHEIHIVGRVIYVWHGFFV